MRAVIRKIFLGLFLLSLFATLVAFIESITFDNVDEAKKSADAVAGLLILAFIFALPYFLISKTKKIKISKHKYFEKCKSCNASKAVLENEVYVCAYCNSTLMNINKK